jgi:hypothetical protein
MLLRVFPLACCLRFIWFMPLMSSNSAKATMTMLMTALMNGPILSVSSHALLSRHHGMSRI